MQRTFEFWSDSIARLDGDTTLATPIRVSIDVECHDPKGPASYVLEALEGPHGPIRYGSLPEDELTRLDDACAAMAMHWREYAFQEHVEGLDTYHKDRTDHEPE